MQDTTLTQTQSPKPRLVKLLADTSSRRIQLALLCSAFLTLILLYTMAAFLVPHTFKSLHGIPDCGPPHQYKGLCHNLLFRERTTWLAYIGMLDKQHQFLLLGGRVKRFESETEIDLELDYKIEVSPVDDYGNDHEETEEFKETREHVLKVKCHKGDVSCSMNYFMIYPQIQHKIYKVVLEIDVPNEYKGILKGIEFDAEVVNKKFTNFSLVLRYTFLTLSIISGIFYLLFFFRTPAALRTFEHKYIAVFTVALVLFNDPFYFLTIYEANEFLACLSTFWVVLFATLLLLFWVIMFQRMTVENVQIGTKLINRYSVSIAVLGFIFFMVTGCVAAVAYRFDPGFHAETEYPLEYKIFRIITIVFILFLLVTFIFHLIRIYKTWKKVIPRHKLFFTLSLYFMLAFFFFVIDGYYSSYDSDGVKQLLVIYLNNLYVFFLQLLWRFDRDGSEDFKDFLDQRNMQKRSTEERKRELGLNYFDEKYDVEVKTESKNSSMCPLNKEDKSINEINQEMEDRNVEKQKFKDLQDKIEGQINEGSSDDDTIEDIVVEDEKEELNNDYKQFDNNQQFDDNQKLDDNRPFDDNK